MNMKKGILSFWFIAALAGSVLAQGKFGGGDGSGSSSGSLPNQALPVALISFDATLQGADVLLEWSTASELNNAQFAIQRSEDGRIFNSMDSVLGSGVSVELKRYIYTDKQVKFGRHYYRLKQVDFDGSVSFSKVVRVYREEQKVVLLYPNPTTNELNIEIEDEAILSCKVFDLQGVKVLSSQFEATEDVLFISTKNLAEGVYLLQLHTVGGIVYRRFVKE